MKKTSPRPGAHGRHLTKDDEALWEGLAATLAPLKAGKGRVSHKVSAASDELRADSSPMPGVQPVEGRNAVTTRNTSDRSAVASGPPPLGTFDRGVARRLKAGRAEIEARIDLHGMRQSEAHTALRRFLTTCHARGRRIVLVITGRGASVRRNGDERAGEEPPGVLRRNVPLWLCEPEMRAVVVSYASSALHHGGEGALYVQLRKPERTKR